MTDYAGDVTFEEVWRVLKDDPSAVLVDVRTRPEWAFVGAPNLGEAAKAVVPISWQVFPAMDVNPAFVEEVTAAGAKPDSKIYFLCRSGVRSRAAAIAMTAAGFSNCFNISGGFEGDLDGDQHRGKAGGWKAAGLPWVQS
jgi:rhodanese-related sulfurtransferase